MLRRLFQFIKVSKMSILGLVLASFCVDLAHAEPGQGVSVVGNAYIRPRFSGEELQVKRIPVGLSEGISRIVGEGQGRQVFGSGLTYRKRGRSGFDFFTLSDKKYSYASPDGIAPLLGVLKVKRETATIGQAIAVRPESLSQTNILGAPVDLEGVAVAGEKDRVWIADEKSLSLLKVNSKTGVVVDRVMLGERSSLFGSIQENRGFEGVAELPDGSVLLALQSSLDGQGASEAGVVRFYRYYPSTKELRVYFYRPRMELFSGSDKVKIGGLQSLGDERILLLEHGEGADEAPLALVIETSLRGGTALSIKEDRPISKDEFNQDQEGSLIALPRTELLNLRELGWEAPKTEGIALAGDGATLAVINDPDSPGEELSLLLIGLPESLLPWRFSDYLVVGVLLILTVGMVAFVIAVLLQEAKGVSREAV